MDLNIGFVKGESFVSKSLPTLKAWNIYKVAFEKCEYSKFAGKKEPDVEYETLSFTFKGEQGQYVASLFAPKPGDEVRKTRTNSNGHEIPIPSNLDNFKFELGQLLTFICPKILEKFSGKSLSFQDLAKSLPAALEKSKGKEVYIKLIGDKKNRPRFPYFLSFFEGQSDPVITNNFISDNENALGFTEYELSQKDKIENAKPTDMASIENGSEMANPDVAESSDDLDLDLASL